MQCPSDSIPVAVQTTDVSRQQDIFTQCSADAVQVSFEDVLPYKDFALRVPQYMIWALPHVLTEFLEDHERVRRPDSPIS